MEVEEAKRNEKTGEWHFRLPKPQPLSKAPPPLPNHQHSLPSPVKAGGAEKKETD